MKLLSAKFLAGLLLFILIISLFFFTRSAEHISGNFVFILDQGRDYVFVRDMVLNLKPTLIGSEIGGGYAGFQGIFQGPFHFYFLSIFFLLFGGNPYGGVVYMGIFAALAVIASFIFAKKIFKNSILGLVMALLITISPPLIAQAKFLWNPYPVTVFLILSFLFTYLSQSKDRKYLFLAGFFSAFTYNFEIATTVPLLISLIIFELFVVKLRKIKEHGSLAFGIIIGLLPFLLFQLRHNFTAISGILSYIGRFQTDSKSGYGLINNHLDKFVYNFGDTFSHQNIIPPVLVLVLFVTSLIALLLNEKRLELKKFIIFLGILLISTILVLSFLRNHIFMYYIYQLNLIYIFLFTYILYASGIQKRIDIKTIFLVLLTIYALFAFKDGIRDFKNDLSDSTAYQKVKAKIQAVDYIYDDAIRKPFGVFVFAPTVYTYPYDYLLWWRGKYKFDYQPTQSKEGLFYLLIEKDPGAPWTYKGWQETVIKEGRVIEIKVLPSGLIVEKRCGPLCPTL